jgi:hypothetical protein
MNERLVIFDFVREKTPSRSLEAGACRVTNGRFLGNLRPAFPTLGQLRSDRSWSLRREGGFAEHDRLTGRNWPTAEGRLLEAK